MVYKEKGKWPNTVLRDATDEWYQTLPSLTKTNEVRGLRYDWKHFWARHTKIHLIYRDILYLQIHLIHQDIQHQAEILYKTHLFHYQMAIYLLIATPTLDFLTPATLEEIQSNVCSSPDKQHLLNAIPTNWSLAVQ